MLTNRQTRAIIENLTPEIDGGRFPIKRITGERVIVTADVFADGHDAVWANVLYRRPGNNSWKEVSMKQKGNDRWEASFTVEEVGTYAYTIEGGVDYFTSWQKSLKKKFAANQDVKVDILTGIQYLEAASRATSADDKKTLLAFMECLKTEAGKQDAVSTALSEELSALMHKYRDKRFAARYAKELTVVVDRPKALFSAWYERFPRSCAAEPGRHGTLKDCEALLPEIARMGFDVFYLPPIHPIGKKKRKGKNNASVSVDGNVGSPWAIGASEGGHKSIHPQLGAFEDMESLINKAKGYGIEIALDLAFQCSPDHPYVAEHPEWFIWRPNGSVQHAENPPKKYEDVLPLNFDTEQWQSLWEELKSIVVFWAEKGIRIFRVDNPHTKPFLFWEWLIREVKDVYPDVLFLAEAFTRPKVMNFLAKAGFTQSYTYFTWRNTKREIIEYVSQLAHSQTKEYFRPNFWPNTPDILPEHLQHGGRPVFMVRLVLAATLSSSYGIYGPPFELCVGDALQGKEEYLDSEKYEIRPWDWDKPGNLKDFIARVNRIRRENPALQTTWNVQFCETNNDNILAYGKVMDDTSDIMLVVVNLDPYHVQSGWVKVPVDVYGISGEQPYLAHDLLGGDKYIWQGENNYVELNPQISPAYIFNIRKRLKRETDFDYFM